MHSFKLSREKGLSHCSREKSLFNGGGANILCAITGVNVLNVLGKKYYSGGVYVH